MSLMRFMKSIKIVGVVLASLPLTFIAGCGVSSQSPADVCAKAAACDAERGVSWSTEQIQACTTALAMIQPVAPRCYACMVEEVDTCDLEASDSCDSICAAEGEELSGDDFVLQQFPLSPVN